MKSTDAYLQMRLIEKTAAAVKVTGSKALPVAGGPAMSYYWLPRSLIGYSRTEPVAGELPLFTFTLPEWKIEQENLCNFVQS